MRKVLGVMLAAFLLFAVTAMAKTKKSLKLHQNATVAGTELKAGVYNIEVEDNEVVFFRGSKEVARSAARVENLPAKHASDAVRYEGKALVEIRPGGTATTLFLTDPKGGSSGVKSGAYNR